MGDVNYGARDTQTAVHKLAAGGFMKQLLTKRPPALPCQVTLHERQGLLAYNLLEPAIMSAIRYLNLFKRADLAA